MKAVLIRYNDTLLLNRRDEEDRLEFKLTYLGNLRAYS